MTDVATWLAMVLNDGQAADGTQVVDPAALRAALTPVMRAADGSPIPPAVDGRAGFYGYGFNVGTDAPAGSGSAIPARSGWAPAPRFLAFPTWTWASSC